MTRVICCNRFLSQSVLSPDWPVGCHASCPDCLIVASGPRCVKILEWVPTTASGSDDPCLQLRQCGQLEIGLPLIQARCCPESGLLLALCTAEDARSGTATVCQAFLDWRHAGSDGHQQSVWRHQFVDHKRVNLIRVDRGRAVLVEGRSVSIYALVNGGNGSRGFELATALQMEFIVTQLEMSSADNCLLAAAANRIALVQLRQRPTLSMVGTGSPALSLFDFEDLTLSGSATLKEKQLSRLDAKPKERLFPSTKPVCRVSFNHQPHQTTKTWLLKTVSLQGDDRLHSLALWHYDATHLMSFFSTHTHGFIFCLNIEENKMGKLAEIRYNSSVISAVVGTDGLLHTMSTDLLESYTTHLPMCGCPPSSSGGGDSGGSVPNLLFGSQMFPGIVSIGSHAGGLLLLSAVEDESKKLLSTFYTLTFEAAPNLVEDLIDKCLDFKQDSEDIYRHLACEAAFLLKSAASSHRLTDAQTLKFLGFTTDLIRAHPEDRVASKLLLDFLRPNLELLVQQLDMDAGKMLQSPSLSGYIRDCLRPGPDSVSRLPGEQSAAWPLLEQTLRALASRDATGRLLVHLLAAVPNWAVLRAICRHQLPRLNQASLLGRLASFVAARSVDPPEEREGAAARPDDVAAADDSAVALSEAEISDSLASVAELMPLEQYVAFFQELYASHPMAVYTGMESLDRSEYDYCNCNFAKRLPWPLSVYFVELRWLQPLLDDGEAVDDICQAGGWSDLLVDLLTEAVRRCKRGDGCSLLIDASLTTPEGLLKRLMSLLYNLPGVASRGCCCIQFVAQRILLLLWYRHDRPVPVGFAGLCASLGSLDRDLAACLSYAPRLIGCQRGDQSNLAGELLPLLRLAEENPRRRLIGCLRLRHEDWLAMDAAAGASQSDRAALRELASRFADKATMDALLLGNGSTEAGDELLFRCASGEGLRSHHEELTILLAAQLADQ